jgi:hypothetical protein
MRKRFAGNSKFPSEKQTTILYAKVRLPVKLTTAIEGITNSNEKTKAIQ